VEEIVRWGGSPPPYLSPDPTIQRADVDTPIQTVQNFVSGPDRVMGSSPLLVAFYVRKAPCAKSQLCDAGFDDLPTSFGFSSTGARFSQAIEEKLLAAVVIRKSARLVIKQLRRAFDNLPTSQRFSSTGARISQAIGDTSLAAVYVKKRLYRRSEVGEWSWTTYQLRWDQRGCRKPLRPSRWLLGRLENSSIANGNLGKGV
jgi:hypothetical protein